MKRTALPLSAALIFSCATAPTPVDTKPTPAPVSEEKLRITNAKPFDVASCAPRVIETGVLTAESLTGVLVAARPMFVECLVNPKHHQPGDAKGEVKASVTDAAATLEVSGDTLTTDGKTCIEGALARLKLEKLPAGSKPIAAQIEFALPKADQLTLGDNVANDAVATVRLAQSSMCGCYSELGINAPPMVKAAIKLAPGKPAEVKIESSADAVALKLATCVEGTVKALTWPTSEREIQLAYDFQLLNSAALGASTDAPAELKFRQLDAISIQNRADVAVAIGQRSLAALSFDEVALKYKRKASTALNKEFKEKCAGVQKADDGWVAALSKLLETQNAEVSAVQSLKATDAAWADVEKSLLQAVQQTKTDVAAAEAQKKSDGNACPKVK